MIDEIDGYGACQILMALKLHFTTQKYDFHKYGGKVKLTEETFSHRKDHYVCNKLAKIYPTKQKFVDFASTVYAHSEFPNKLWTNDFLSAKSVNTWKDAKSFHENFSYRFEQEIDNTFSYAQMSGIPIGNLIIPENGGEPPIFKFHKMEPKKLSLEGLTVLNRIMNITNSCDRMVDDDLIYPRTRNRILKYELFAVSRIDDFYEKGTEILKAKVKEYI